MRSFTLPITGFELGLGLEPLVLKPMGLLPWSIMIFSAKMRRQRLVMTGACHAVCRHVDKKAP
jgi:hypothetical protein